MKVIINVNQNSAYANLNGQTFHARPLSNGAIEVDYTNANGLIVTALFGASEWVSAHKAMNAAKAIQYTGKQLLAERSVTLVGGNRISPTATYKVDNGRVFYLRTNPYQQWILVGYVKCQKPASPALAFSNKTN